MFGPNFAEAFGSNLFSQAVASGIQGGITSVINGGKFGDGFISSALSTGIGGSKLFKGTEGEGLNAVETGGLLGKAGVTTEVRGILLAGTVSELTGGKFASGAASAAASMVASGVVEALSPEASNTRRAGNANEADYVQGEASKARKARLKASSSEFTKEINRRFQNDVPGLINREYEVFLGFYRDQTGTLQSEMVFSKYKTHFADGQIDGVWAKIQAKGGVIVGEFHSHPKKGTSGYSLSPDDIKFSNRDFKKYGPNYRAFVSFPRRTIKTWNPAFGLSDGNII